MMDGKINTLYLILICCLSLPAYSAESVQKKALPVAKVDGGINSNNADGSIITNITTKGGAEWQLIAKPDNEENSEQYEGGRYKCTLKYKLREISLSQKSFSCNIDDMTVDIDARSIDSNDAIINFSSERGGVAWIVSITKDKYIDWLVIPYMTGDEDSVSFLIDDKRAITVLSRDDKYILAPDDNNRYSIHFYEGAGTRLE